MIFRRAIRDVVEERHGRTCGVHVFLFYIAALWTILGLSMACLVATEEGYFAFEQSVRVNVPSGMSVDYKISYGWRSMCSRASAKYLESTTSDDDAPSNNQPELDTQPTVQSGCFDLRDTVLLGDFPDVTLAAGSSMMANTGLAVALGHAVIAAVAATHILFFTLLYFNIDPAPVKGYLYMRGLGLMSALSSFYLLFTCVVTFFFSVKGGLDRQMATSEGLTPSWSYVLTVINVTLLVVVGMLACQDDEVDAAIATPQYTSSSRDEDTVKRASGKLLHLRSRSSDTVCEMSTSQNMTSIAPKVTVGVGGGTGASGGGGGGLAGAHPPASAGVTASAAGVGGLLQGGGGAGSTLRMSAAASSAAAHAAASAAFVRLTASSPAGSSGSGGSGSVLSSWTGGVSALSPPRREGRRDEEEGGGLRQGQGGQDVGSSGSGCNSPSGTRRRSSGGILDAALEAASADGNHDGLGGGNSNGAEGQEGRQDGRRNSGENDAGGGGGHSSREAGGAGEGQRGGDNANTPTTAAILEAGPSSSPPPVAATVAPPAEVAVPVEAAPALPPPHSPAPERAGEGELMPVAQALADFSTARTVLSVAFEEAGDEPLDIAEAGRRAVGGGGSDLRELQSPTPPPSARFPADEEV